MEAPSNKMHKKNCYDPRYTDNWNTPKDAYEDIIPFVTEYVKKHGIQQLVIWDPFFNADGGTAKQYLDEVFGTIGAKIIHQDKWVDMTDSRVPEYAIEANLIITNPPYSKKNKLLTTKWMQEMQIPFMSLMPMETTMLKCMRPYLKEGLQMVIPNGRICFEGANGEKSRNAPLGTSWFCFGMDFESTNNFLD